MRLVIVGASGSFAGPDSAASCYVVQAEDEAGREWNLVIDLGSGAFGPLCKTLAPERIDAVAITHLHSDHCADLVGLNVYARYRPKGPLDPIAVYGPAHTAWRVTSEGGPDVAPSQMAFDIRTWEDGVPIEVGPLTVTPRRVLHPVVTFALRVEGPSSQGGRASLAHTGDSDLCPALASLAEGADLLLAEASFVEGRDALRGMHLTGARAGRLASEAGVGRLVLTHLVPWNDPDVALEEARGTWSGPLDLARPGQTYTL